MPDEVANMDGMRNDRTWGARALGDAVGCSGYGGKPVVRRRTAGGMSDTAMVAPADWRGASHATSGTGGDRLPRSAAARER